MSKQVKLLKRSTAPLASLSAAATKPTLGKKLGTVQAVEGGADMTAVAISARTVVEERATAFAITLSETTVEDMARGADIEEERQKNALEIMLDLRNDNAEAIAAAHAGNGDDPLLLLPAPNTVAPVDKAGVQMNPRRWVEAGNNAPWPYDKWSEKVTQSQGGQKKENFSFYLVVIEQTAAGKKDLAELIAIKEQLANHTAGKPLTGIYQTFKKDELETEETRLENRRKTMLRNMREAIGLYRQFDAFERFETASKAAGYSYPEFRVLTKKNDQGQDVLSGSKKPIRFAIATRNATGGIDRDYRTPISRDTFLDYDADIYAHNIKLPGADVYNAVTSSASTGAEENKKAIIKLPLGVESFLTVAGVSASFMESTENVANVTTRLSKKDAKGDFENADEIRSICRMHLLSAQFYATFGAWFDADNVATAKAAAAAIAAKAKAN
jgi:hypothetical protein